MAFELKRILSSFLTGVFDSLRGFVGVFRLDKAMSKPAQQPDSDKKSGSDKYPDQSAKPTPLPKKPLTVLEMRREQRMKAQQKLKLNAESPSKTSSGGEKTGVREKPKARIRVAQCAALNVACICLLYLVQQLYNYASAAEESSTEENSGGSTNGFLATVFWALAVLLKSLWVLPFFLITRLVNILWFQDIANAALKNRGKDPVQQSFSRSIADFLMAVLLETLFLIQGSSVHFFVPVPYVAPILTYVHMCLLCALYSFEYYWMSCGIELKSRLQKIESYWPYYLGFGLPLALATLIPHSKIVSGCLFGALFPFFIVSSYQARGERYQGLNPQEVTDSIPVFPIFAPTLSVCNRISLWMARQANLKQRSLIERKFKAK